jgi:hypothetical protein
VTPTKKRVWTQPGFVIAVVILAVSAVGMNAAIAYLGWVLKKEPVKLTRELTEVPVKVGTWVQVSTDEPLDPDLQQELATDKYIFRDYVDSSKVSAAELARFEGKTAKQRKDLAAILQRAQPDAVVNLAVTYYTGKVDTVAHIPERCYVADGYVPQSQDTVMWDMGPNRLGHSVKSGADQKLGARYLNFVDQTATGRLTRRVAYFFFANGKYESDSLKVRQTLQDLQHKHAFYSKVELMSVIQDDATAQRVMAGFLKAVMPEVEKCYPDWDSVEGGKK